ncbi:polysaccharide pyruvyl transferase family protein [Mycobacterium sp. MS1601]|uniref:polysaccharide pyruvyl transferase family protein n=1 Tax=Mycobacterium sp. MS1601 TaxID=1936029 RepID=UPI0012F8B28D|nr:polysaccharide pyruvyl transferase family protein [Mycobacterium sp. MS1601]
MSYLGWHHKGNIGDDAIYDAVRLQLAEAEFVDMPRFPSEMIRSTTTGLSKSLRRSVHVLGGGTLVGRRHWRRLAGRAVRITSKQGSYAVGIGVEDPAFQGRRSGSGNDELKRWASLLGKFNRVSVRGPRSAELLADIGFDAEVVGDPALLLPRPAVSAEEGLIGVNLGFGDDLWGHDPEALVSELTAAVDVLALKGFRFVGILMNPSDAKWTRAALQNVGADVVQPVDAVGAARALALCSAVIVSRLHAGILAALSETPVISLEYQPKCRDFALSIDDERSLIRTDQVTAGAVVDKVLSTVEDAAAIRTTTRAAVERLQSRLCTDYGAIRTTLGLA